jgi:hypothetical protein
MTLAILGDIGGRPCEPDIASFAQDRDPEVSKVRALRVVAR